MLDSPTAVAEAREALWDATRRVAGSAADFTLTAANLDRPISETPWLAGHRYGDREYDARWYSVRDAQTMFHERVAVGAREALVAFEAAVRADERAKAPESTRDQKVLSLIEAESERQLALGWDRTHDRTHASPQWTALLTKQVGDLAQAEMFEADGHNEDIDSGRWQRTLVQLTTVALKALGWSGDSLTRQTNPPESALRASARDVLTWGAEVREYPEGAPIEMGDLNGDRVFAALRAALDGAPYEPSEAEVERGVAAWWASPAGADPPSMTRMHAALKAALG